MRVLLAWTALAAPIWASPQAPTVAPTQGNPRISVQIENRGELVIELYPQQAPQTVAHILDLVRRGFYDGVRFHRVENYPKPFIVVAGDPLTKSLPLDDPRVGTGGSGKKLPFEQNNLRFENGTVGLVRDLKDKNSGDSQFFICNGQQRFLEGTYVAFGQVVQGLEIIPKIQLGDRIVTIRQIR